MDNENRDIKMEETPIGIKPLEGGNETTSLPVEESIVAAPSVNAVPEQNTEIKLVRTQTIPVQNEVVREEVPMTEVGIVNNPEPPRNNKKKTSISDIIMYIIMVVIIIIIILLLLKFCEDGKNDGKGLVTTTKAGEVVKTSSTTKTVMTNTTSSTTTVPVITNTTTGTTTKKVNKDTTTTTRPKTSKKTTTSKKKPNTQKPGTTSTTTTTTTKKPAPEYTYTYENFYGTFYKVTVYKKGKVLTDRYCIMDSSGQVPLNCNAGTVELDLDDIDFSKKPTITIVYESTGESHKVVHK